MAGSIKLLKRRIKSIESTRKLTKAMQMIAAVNMRKAVTSTQAAQPFALQTVYLLDHFSKYLSSQQISHPYVQEKPLQHVLGVVITSNRGLCGSFHSQLEKKVRSIVQEPRVLLKYPFDEMTAEEKKQATAIDFSWIVIGKKGERMVKKLNQPIVASFNQLNEKVESNELDVIFKMIEDEFATGKYQKVIIFYTRYQSAMLQQPVMRQLLPIVPQEVQRTIDEWQIKDSAEKMNEARARIDFLVEPDDQTLMTTVFKLLLKTILYHAVLTSKASVESARMMAMKNATDAASEMGEILLLNYNQLRQSKITNEIAEISAGRAALE
ncbi:MAG: ATP synthase F1 subunit gamma [bacterium]|nr:ATP synthase F1 subunit gamma [bacterium]